MRGNSSANALSILLVQGYRNFPVGGQRGRYSARAAGFPAESGLVGETGPGCVHAGIPASYGVSLRPGPRVAAARDLPARAAPWRRGRSGRARRRSRGSCGYVEAAEVSCSMVCVSHGVTSSLPGDFPAYPLQGSKRRWAADVLASDRGRRTFVCAAERSVAFSRVTAVQGDSGV
jgi:hypothetical protein